MIFGPAVIVEVIYLARFIGPRRRETVNRDRTRKNYFADPEFSADFADIFASLNVDFVVKRLRSDVVAVFCRQIYDDIASGKNFGQRVHRHRLCSFFRHAGSGRSVSERFRKFVFFIVLVSDVAPDPQIRIGVTFAFVRNLDIMTCVKQPSDEARSDKTRTADNCDFHLFSQNSL